MSGQCHVEGTELNYRIIARGMGRPPNGMFTASDLDVRVVYMTENLYRTQNKKNDKIK